MELCPLDINLCRANTKPSRYNGLDHNNSPNPRIPLNMMGGLYVFVHAHVCLFLCVLFSNCKCKSDLSRMESCHKYMGKYLPDAGLA